MAGEVAATEYKDLVIFLAAAGIVVPLFHRLRISPILGFLAAGILLGPDGLGRLADEFEWISFLTIADRSQFEVLAEFGVVFLLFMIGLELSWERLKSLRRYVFGLGVLQILLCGAVLGGAFMLLGQTLASAAILGLALALSSTAVVMPVMAERKRLGGGAGRAVFAVLLAQDLSVGPILITVTVLAAGAAGSGGAAWAQGLLALAPAALGLALIVLAGRVVLRPMFRSVARAGSQEMFVAACLFVIIGTGLAAQLAGLSMGLGAFVAGLLLAETEYRRAIEINIEPFKGLLLGVFFVSVGVGLDLEAVAAQWPVVIGVAAGLTVLKIAAVFGLGRAFGLNRASALEAAMVLGPAGEFAFVILASAMEQGVVPAAFAQGVMLSATVSIFTIPFLAMAAERLTRTDRREPEHEVTNDALEAGDSRVLIVGYGRVGRLVGTMLARHEVPFIAVDSDPRLVAQARRDGARVYFGDATRSDLLQRCGAQSVQAMVVTMDSPAKADEVVKAARALREDLILIARARDAAHAARLYALGVTDAVPETTEASLQLAENTLVDLGVPMGLVLASIHEQRDEFRALFQEATPEGRTRPTRALRARRLPVTPKSA